MSAWGKSWSYSWGSSWGRLAALFPWMGRSKKYLMVPRDQLTMQVTKSQG